jgi:hypothetical protein
LLTNTHTQTGGGKEKEEGEEDLFNPSLQARGRRGRNAAEGEEKEDD